MKTELTELSDPETTKDKVHQYNELVKEKGLTEFPLFLGLTSKSKDLRRLALKSVLTQHFLSLPIF